MAPGNKRSGAQTQMTKPIKLEHVVLAPLFLPPTTALRWTGNGALKRTLRSVHPCTNEEILSSSNLNHAFVSPYFVLDQETDISWLAVRLSVHNTILDSCLLLPQQEGQGQGDIDARDCKKLLPD